MSWMRCGISGVNEVIWHPQNDLEFADNLIVLAIITKDTDATKKVCSSSELRYPRSPNSWY